MDPTGRPGPADLPGMQEPVLGPPAYATSQAHTRNGEKGQVKNIYEPGGGPRYWKYETSGLMAAAIKAFFDEITEQGPGPTPEQLRVLIKYCQHWINAPVWLQNPHLGDNTRAELMQLRERAKSLASAESVRLWMEEAQEIGIDPF